MNGIREILQCADRDLFFRRRWPGVVGFCEVRNDWLEVTVHSHCAWLQQRLLEVDAAFVHVHTWQQKSIYLLTYLLTYLYEQSCVYECVKFLRISLQISYLIPCRRLVKSPQRTRNTLPRTSLSVDTLKCKIRGEETTHWDLPPSRSLTVVTCLFLVL